MPRFLTDRRLSSAQVPSALTDFYREEIVKHRQCLRRQREYYSERAITEVDAALSRLIMRLEQLCMSKNADKVVGRLLRELDAVTGLSASSDSKKSN
jgi:Mg-chelatase subunit ChlI